jgi:hypothetical protein
MNSKMRLGPLSAAKLFIMTRPVLYLVLPSLQLIIKKIRSLTIQKKLLADFQLPKQELDN